MVRDNEERRNKGKDKYKERKKHPYKKGGRQRAFEERIKAKRERENWVISREKSYFKR